MKPTLDLSKQSGVGRSGGAIPIKYKENVNVNSFSENVKLNSRLSCQIEISEEHEGLTVELPKAQY